jgi:hypothetical protein
MRTHGRPALSRKNSLYLFLFRSLCRDIYSFGAVDSKPGIRCAVNAII